MSERVLEKLFSSAARIKIIRLFLLNHENLFTPTEISRRCKVLSSAMRREISVLKSIGFIKDKSETVETLISLKKGKIKNKKKRTKINGFVLNNFFPLLNPLKKLVLNAAPLNKEKMVKNLGAVGRIKLVVLSGIFIQSDESRLDILLVGDSVQKGKLERLIKNIEAEVGRELQYGLFSTKEFLYRMEMYDKFIRDIFDYPHEKVLNKLNI